MKKLAMLIGVAMLFALFAMTVMAADVSGTYKQKVETPKGTQEQTIVLKQDGDKLTGSVTTARGSTDIKTGTVKGDQVEFTIERQMGGNAVTMTYKAKVTDAGLDGTVQTGEKPAREFKAARQ